MKSICQSLPTLGVLSLFGLGSHSAGHALDCEHRELSRMPEHAGCIFLQFRIHARAEAGSLVTCPLFPAFSQS